MLIVGLAEPIGVMYGFMYDLAVNNPDIGHDLFRPWCAWVCIWVSAFCTLYSALGVTRLIRYFTRYPPLLPHLFIHYISNPLLTYLSH